jgi:hypothetical protein
MIEAIAVPLLVKAIDFLFDESKKILEERRMRRQAKPENTIKKDDWEAKQPSPTLTENAQLVPQINAKQTALSTMVDKARWRDSEKELMHLLELCEIYKTNLYNAKEKYARFGRDYAPPHLLHEIKEAEDGVLDAAKRLNNLLTQIYDKEIIIPDLDLES